MFIYLHKYILGIGITSLLIPKRTTSKQKNTGSFKQPKSVAIGAAFRPTKNLEPCSVGKIPPEMLT